MDINVPKCICKYHLYLYILDQDILNIGFIILVCSVYNSLTEAVWTYFHTNTWLVWFRHFQTQICNKTHIADENHDTHLFQKYTLVYFRSCCCNKFKHIG